jgi:hypothetical protein
MMGGTHIFRVARLSSRQVRSRNAGLVRRENYETLIGMFRDPFVREAERIIRGSFNIFRAGQFNVGTRVGIMRVILVLSG